MEPLFDAKALTDLLNDAVRRWHNEAIAPAHADPALNLALWLQAHNFMLWHEEDKARDPGAEDAMISQVKRTIDKLNQQRNDAMEKVDEFVLQGLQRGGVAPGEGTRIHSESVGAIVDRLSILALKVFHMREQTERSDTDPAHQESCMAKLAVLEEQQGDLAQSLADLHDDLLAGRRRFKVYRQMKMYNDPSLNPVLYQKKK